LTLLPQAEDSLGIRLRQQCQLQRFVSYLHVLEASLWTRCLCFVDLRHKLASIRH